LKNYFNNKTKIIGLHHWRRGYERLEEKLVLLGAKIKVVEKMATQDLTEQPSKSSVEINL